MTVMLPRYLKQYLVADGTSLLVLLKILIFTDLIILLLQPAVLLESQFVVGNIHTQDCLNALRN